MQKVAMETIVVKFGGGVISDKRSMCKSRREVISHLCHALAEVRKRKRCRIILCHGAGSFGHRRSRHWQLASGYMPDVVFQPDGQCTSQIEAVFQTRADLLELNSILCDELKKCGLRSRCHPPREWASESGQEFLGNVRREFEHKRANEVDVDVTFGDVVPCKNRQFGILSGDDIVVRLALELPRVTHLIFVADVDGLLTRPPDKHGTLITLWDGSQQFEGKHDDQHDVTGGIFLKIRRASFVAQKSSGRIKCMIVNGNFPERLIQACMDDENVIGTSILPSSMLSKI